jgi:hypothetical protein
MMVRRVHAVEQMEQTMRRLSGAVLLALVLVAPHSAQAQGGAAVYVIQFRDLRTQLNTLAARADALAEHGTPPRNLSFQQDTLALLKLINKLGEDAAQSNLRGMQQGREVDKTLSLVAVGAEALGLESMALDALVDTGDRSFKAAARDADTIAANLEKGM